MNKKHGVYIEKGKKYQTKKIYNNGYLMIKYLYQPLHINFKNKMVNDENQNFCGGWSMGKENLSDEMLFTRTIKGVKPLSVIYGNKIQDLRKFIDFKINKSKFYRKFSGGHRPCLLIAPKGKMKDLFDLETLKEDYSHNEIDIDITKVKNKTLLDYFWDWDAQDKDSKIKYWETGLILGYPIENTISLYNGGVR